MDKEIREQSKTAENTVSVLRRSEQYDELRKAFLDVLDGNSKWYDIWAQTGLTEARCKEIEELFKKLSEEK